MYVVDERTALWVIKRRYHILRILELVRICRGVRTVNNFHQFQILCIVCFGLAIAIFSLGLYIAVKVLLVVVSTTFLVISFVDIISYIVLCPINIRSWTMIAVAAISMFWLCGGFLVFCLLRGYVKSILIVQTVLSFLIGFVYLWDVLASIR